MSEKYPRTPHLPYSPGGTNDDERLRNTRQFIGRKIVILEKMDGGNWCMTREACYARSHSGTTRNPIFDPAKALWAQKQIEIDNDLSVFGEWLYYTHSIHYNALPSFFLLFAARWDLTDVWASWEDVEIYSELLQLPTVPVLWKGKVENERELQRLVETFAAEPSRCGNEREGVVVRLADEVTSDAWQESIAKWVRPSHIQRDPDTSRRNQLFI